MAWISIPLELFASILIDLDVVSIVRLEQVCKTFEDNLKNQNIWKDIAVRAVPNNSVPENENWREVALKRFIVRLNMREKRCLSRAIQTKEALGPYSTMTHNCSVAGNEVLLTLIEDQPYSSPTKRFIAHELVNLTTGERKLLDGTADRPNALLTKNYIVTAGGSVTSQHINAQPNLEALDRRTGETFKIDIQIDAYKLATMQQNEDEKYDSTICINSGVNFYVVDLKERKTRCIKVTNETAIGTNIPFQFYGKCIAYSSTPRMNGKGRLRLTIIDIDTEKQVYFEQNEQLLDWAIADNKIFMGLHTENGVKWILKNFNGEILHQYNMNTNDTSDNYYHPSNVRIFDHVVIYLKRTQMYFFDIHNGEFLCVLEIANEFGTIPYLHAISPGKFICSQKYSMLLLDFESRFITKPIKVKIISPNNFTDTLPTGVHEPVPFNELANFTRAVAQVRSALDLSFYWSICVSQTNQKRVSMFYCNDYVPKQNGGKTQQKNELASKLFSKANKLRIYSHVNMTPTNFLDENVVPERRGSYFSLQPGDIIKDHVVLYNEMFMKGEWVPVDYEEYDAHTVKSIVRLMYIH